MKSCEEYILKQYLNQKNVIQEKNKTIEELLEKIYVLENPILEILERAKKVNCITLYKSANVVYRLITNTYLHNYKGKFEEAIKKGKINLEDLKKSLEDDQKLDEINDLIHVDDWGYNKKMYQFNPITSDIFEFNIDKVQYIIHGNYDNLSLSKLNNLDSSTGYFYESYKEQVLQKVRIEVRETLKNTIKYLEELENES